MTVSIPQAIDEETPAATPFLASEIFVACKLICPFSYYYHGMPKMLLPVPAVDYNFPTFTNVS
jgi:hypothetical protein